MLKIAAQSVQLIGQPLDHAVARCVDDDTGEHTRWGATADVRLLRKQADLLLRPCASPRGGGETMSRRGSHG